MIQKFGIQWKSIAGGLKIKTFVNGNLVTDFDGTGILDDEIHLQKNVGISGKIALQLHAHDELLIRYKDIKIKTVSETVLLNRRLKLYKNGTTPKPGFGKLRVGGIVQMY